jgi:hypothetical protein
VIGIPSRNEESTIRHVTRQVDEGLSRLAGDPTALIVNVDNSATDGTRSAFLSTSTRYTKESHRPDRAAGKGANVCTILRLASRYEARVVALLDADVRTVSPDWVCRLVGPVRSSTADFVSPHYATSQGGPLRALISRPLVHGLFLADVDQPTGGEVAFTAALNSAFQRVEPSGAVSRYGIDIFMITEAVLRGARLACADLGTKVHRPRPWHTITPIARDVVTAVLEQAHRNRSGLRERQPVSVTAVTRGPNTSVRRTVDAAELAALSRDFRAGVVRHEALYREFLSPALMRALRADGTDGITAAQWPDILFPLIRHALANPNAFDEFAAALMPLFEGRMMRFANESAA